MLGKGRGQPTLAGSHKCMNYEENTDSDAQFQHVLHILQRSLERPVAGVDERKC